MIGSLFLTLYPFKPPCGGLACGIDFKGGTVLEISTAPQAVDIGKVRAALDGMNLGDVQVQGFGAPSSAHGQLPDPAGRRRQRRRSPPSGRSSPRRFGQVKFSRTDVVGPEGLRRAPRPRACWRLGLAILLMLLYIWFRFELQFGLGAVAALFHDVILTFGLIARSTADRVRPDRRSPRS